MSNIDNVTGKGLERLACGYLEAEADNAQLRGSILCAIIAIVLLLGTIVYLIAR